MSGRKGDAEKDGYRRRKLLALSLIFVASLEGKELICSLLPTPLLLAALATKKPNSPDELSYGLRWSQLVGYVVRSTLPAFLHSDHEPVVP